MGTHGLTHRRTQRLTHGLTHLFTHSLTDAHFPGALRAMSAIAFKRTTGVGRYDARWGMYTRRVAYLVDYVDVWLSESNGSEKESAAKIQRQSRFCPVVPALQGGLYSQSKIRRSRMTPGVQRAARGNPTITAGRCTTSIARQHTVEIHYERFHTESL